jgi:predicted RNA-binding Zn-ribbon protein involved in translation (DUF1610 family)
MKELTEQQKDAAIKHMQGAKPKFHKGRYGTKYDYHTCGACGCDITVVYDYCPNCGTRILWDSPRCLTGQV